MRAFLGTIDAQLEVDQSFVPDRQRENDFYLMDLAMSSDVFTAKQLRQVNYCRLYLQVVTASDVVLPSGYQLDESLRAGDLDLSSSTTRFVRVTQGKPNKKTWAQWSRLMNLIDDDLSYRPLGQWLFSASELRRNWPCYLDLRSKLLYIRSAEGFIQYALTSSGDYDHGLVTASWTPTDHCVPVEADPSGVDRLRPKCCDHLP
jgi:hypothetical protein